MDIEKIKSTLQKLSSDENLKSEFKNNPVGTLKNTLGINLPDEQLESISKVVMSKLDSDGDGTIDILENLGGLDKILGGEGGALDKLKGLFGGK